MNPRIRHVIFDLDGTLIDSSDGVVEAVNYSLRKVGAKERDPDEIKGFIGFPLTHMYPHFTSESIDTLYAYFREKADTSVPDATVALPGADRTIRELHSRGYRMAIATTKVRQNLDDALSKLNWTGLFEASVGGDEVKEVKPAPEAFTSALRLLNASSEDSIAVGDTVNDIAAAQAVPMSVVAVQCPYGNFHTVRALNPDYTIATIADILTILD